LNLPSKTRYIAAQFNAYLHDGLYLQIAEDVCEKAQYMTERLALLGITPAYPVESNAVFVRLPKNILKSLKEEFFFYVWNSDDGLVRLMTTFAHTYDDIDRFVDTVGRLIEEEGLSHEL
jgi:threonine aldolase